jgi:lysozyme
MDEPLSEQNPPPRSNRMTRGGAIVVLACSVIGGVEGLRQNAYPDPATRGPPWTICYGDTSHVTAGERDSVAQCKARLIADLNEEASVLDRCIHVQMGDARYVALLSLGYNIGVGKACRSSVVRFLNAGDAADGCNAFLRYNRAAGIVFPGLTKRREEERALCEEG